MKRLLSLSVFLALLSIAVNATGTATLGLYFGYVPGQMHYSPQSFEMFKMYVYLHNADAFVTGVEYRVVQGSFYPILDYTLPEGALTLGTPGEGVAIVFWPPLDGYAGYNLICAYTCVALAGCYDAGGLVWDYPIRIGPHLESGELRGTYYPNNDFFPIAGLTSILCQASMCGMCIGTEKTSWGSIKSLYR
ncbi:MAG: hypothetical protein NTW97_10985 [Candidatus Krumholzibacteria bacterium]|nr:hypothetical protein [Candidatus Krumholzibacteria bacterium]